MTTDFHILYLLKAIKYENGYEIKMQMIVAIRAKTIDKRIFCHIKLLTTIHDALTSPIKELNKTKINGIARKTMQSNA